MPTANPTVSFVMPFYNCEATLPAAIRSALGQTYADWELVLCDDGSTDRSLACVNDFQDPRISVWSDGARRGLAGRLNECLNRARGRFIARMDADDVSYPQRLEKQVAFLIANPGVHLVGSHMLVHGEDGTALGKRVLPAAHEEIVANPHLGFGLAHPTWLARAEWFRRWRYRPEALRYEDVELLYRSYHESRFANIPEVLYGYLESRGGFRKRLKTRAGRVCFLSRNAAGVAGSTAMQAAVAESFKSLSDALIVTSGLRYQMLKRRETPLTEAESLEWIRLYRDLHRAEQAA